MEIHGIPGSLVELLRPVEGSARNSSLYPKSFEELWNMGDIGRIVQRARGFYDKRNIAFNYSAARGVIGEYRFLSDFRRFFSDFDSHVFNNCRLDNTTDEAGGSGFESYPDHLILSRNGFVYVETKNWIREYAEKHKARIKSQIDATMRNIRLYFKDRWVSSIPIPVLYDAEGTIETDGIRVVRDVSELKKFLSGDSIKEHDKILNILSGLCKGS